LCVFPTIMSQSEIFLSQELDGSLDAFVTSKRPQPEPVATSQEIRDRGSIFVANIYHASTPEAAKARFLHLKHTVHRAKKATHEISAWRCMTLKAGRTGLEGPDDFELVQGSKDDGESWAGGKVLKVMQNMGVIDAVVIVSRWCVSFYVMFLPTYAC
jgi:putative IMPACT (imprinted ancient) family translation regulator